jgi:hypothetical protein
MLAPWVVGGVRRSLLPTGEPCATGGGCCLCWLTICAQNVASNGAWLNINRAPRGACLAVTGLSIVHRVTHTPMERVVVVGSWAHRLKTHEQNLAEGMWKVQHERGAAVLYELLEQFRGFNLKLAQVLHALPTITPTTGRAEA